MKGENQRENVLKGVIHSCLINRAFSCYFLCVGREGSSFDHKCLAEFGKLKSTWLFMPFEIYLINYETKLLRIKKKLLISVSCCIFCD